jgi:hypothetical protein
VPFYVVDRDTGRERLLNRPRTTDDHPYWTQLDTLATSVCALLDDVQDERAHDTTGSRVQLARVLEHTYASALYPHSSRPRVLMGAVSEDLLPERESLRAFLESRQVDVEVVEQAPADYDDPSRYLGGALSQAVMSVHLFGAIPGPALPAFDLPLPYLQLSAALAATTASRPVVWLPLNLDLRAISHPQHREFLQSLLIDRGKLRTAEVLQVSFEDLKAELEERLVPKAKSLWLNVRGREHGGLLIYISHLLADERDVQRLKEFFRQQHCAVSTLNHGDASEQMERRHLTYLKNCDGFVIVCRKEDVEWAEDLALQAWKRAREVERPRKLAVFETPAAGRRQFGFDDDLVIFLKSDEGGQFDGAESFLSALRQ